jgi:AbrB family looped-hinge helix DNA binding protein
MDKLHTARVDSKGRVLLPAELREAHGFEPGTRVTFVENDEEALGVPNLSCWNYRVVRTEAPLDVAAKQNFALYEVFYNEAGEPDAFAEASPPMGASLEELADDLKAMQEALSQPVLEYAELVETCRRNAKPIDPNESTMSLEEFTASLRA